MKQLNRRFFTMAAMAVVLSIGASTLSAQDDNNGNDRGGRRRGGPGGNFDPAQFQQRMMENIRERLGFTKDEEWKAVEPLVQKVMDARREVGFGGAGFGRFGRPGGGGGGDNGGRRNPFGEPSPEAEALQKAVDDNAPAAQIKSALEKYRASRKDKEAKLDKAREDLRKVLTAKQEAQAVLLGLLT